MEGVSGAELRLAGEMVGAAVGAAFAHELTHAAAARLLGGSVRRVDLLNLNVDWEMDASKSRVRDRLINLSPQIVGVGGALLAFWAGAIPAGGVESVPVYLAWFIYTLHGGAADLSLAVAYNDGEIPFPKYNKQLLGAYGCSILGMALYHFRPLAFTGKLAITMGAVYQGLLISSLILLAMSINEWRSANGLEAVALPGR